MKKILVATDFSACAGNAMEYAVQMAHVLKMEVCAIHAIGNLEGVFNNTYNAIYINDYHKNKQDALNIWAESYKNKEELREVPVSAICKVGTVSGVINKYVLENEVELIVMGTMGSTGLSGVFGSNTSIMVEKTKTPILLIPLESRFSKNPTITLATDFSADFSTKDISALNDLMKAFGSQQMTVLNVIEGPFWKKDEAGEILVKKFVAGVDIDFKYIKEPNTIEGILNYIISNQTDILCLVKRHHNLVYRIFNRSTVNKVMNRSIKAVLVLHE